MTDNAPRTGGDIHRLLDEAFAGIEMTPDTQDFKEEVRGNLMARVTELEASGISPADAAHRALAELGDVRELLDGPAESQGSSQAASWSAMSAAAARNRIRPQPRFVVGIVIASIVVVAALALAGLAVIGALPLPIGVVIALAGLVASGAAWIVGDSLSQETTTNHPLPVRRASGYWLATFLALYGLGFGALVVTRTLPVWAVVFAAVGVVAAIILFSFLGATQTNRHKAWTRQMRMPDDYPGSRFEKEPEAAARFGIYTMVIWISGFVAFIILSFTVGWAWSWLALAAAFLVMMLTLARMLFGPHQQ